MAQNLTLLCPPGAEEGAVSHGHHEFLPYRLPDGRLAVDVPRHVAGSLMRVGGFNLYTEPVPPAPPSGEMVRVDRIQGNSSAVNGCEAAADGTVLVPIEMVAELRSHGYLPAEEVARERARLRAERERRIMAVRREYSAIGV